MSAAFLTKPNIDRPVRSSPRPMARRAEAPNVDDGLESLEVRISLLRSQQAEPKVKGAVADSRS